MSSFSRTAHTSNAVSQLNPSFASCPGWHCIVMSPRPRGHAGCARFGTSECQHVSQLAFFFSLPGPGSFAWHVMGSRLCSFPSVPTLPPRVVFIRCSCYYVSPPFGIIGSPLPQWVLITHLAHEALAARLSTLFSGADYSGA